VTYTIPVTDEDERACIRRAQAGDANAFGSLVEKHKGLLKEYCIADLDCPFESAEDIAREAFCLAWKSVRTFNYDTKFSTWVCSIARDHYITINKDRSNQAESCEENKGRLSKDSTVRDCVQRQLAKIRAEYRDVIDFVHLRGMSHKSAAALLGVPLSTVKSRLNLALREAGPLVRKCV
jgi:RNA polymerase sigma-70 factor (ECF subfamily)